jgi:hypothetical protein
MDMTKVYRGVVKDRVVVLLDGEDLPDGSTVEVRVIASGADDAPRVRVPDEVKAEMLAHGLVLEFKDPPMVEPRGNRTPIQVTGKPLSEMIIEDRR